MVELNQTILRELFDYLPEGYLQRKRTKRITGQKDTKCKYHPIFINGRSYQLHIAIYCWHTGHYVVGLDHINQNKKDNRIENLRQASPVQNGANRKGWSKRSPYKGVYPDGKYGRFKACAGRSGKVVHLGMFACPIEAAKAYDKYALENFGEFAYINFPIDKGEA